MSQITIALLITIGIGAATIGAMIALAALGIEPWWILVLVIGGGLLISGGWDIVRAIRRRSQ